MEQVELREQFLNTFQLLTPKQQRVWRYLQSFTKQYRNVYPSHQNIAKACDCHRDTVIQAINRFKKLGWLGVIKRAYRSCVYFLVDELVQIDTRNPKTFQKNLSSYSDIDPTTNPTILKKNKYDSKKNELVENETVQSLQEEGIQISQEDLCKLSQSAKRNPNAMNKAIKDYRALTLKETVRNPVALLISRYNHHANQTEIVCPREVVNLDLSQSDRKALAKLNSQNRKAFLYAYEDYRSYCIFRKVGNIAAFIISRFKSYLNGDLETVGDQRSNLTKIKRLLNKYKLPKNVNIQLLNTTVEVTSGSWFKTVRIDDRGAPRELENLLKRLGAKH